MAKQKQDDQLEHTFSSYVRIRDVTLKTCQRWWIIGRSGERESGISVLAARRDDDDDDIYIYIYIYIYMCVCVCVCWQHFFIDSYLTEHSRHFLSTYFLLILSNCRIERNAHSYEVVMYIQKLHHFYNISSPDDGPKLGRKHLGNN